MSIPLGHCQISENQIGRVVGTLRANRLSRGPETKEFEGRVGAEHAVGNAILVNSGTDALRIFLRASKEKFGWRRGDKVKIPATTFIATAEAVIDEGLEPVLCDVDAVTGNICPDSVFREKWSSVVAVLLVHLLGRSADTPTISSIADSFCCDVIEDACEAIGVSRDGVPVCSTTLGGAISTYICHHISTGIGGMILTNDDDLATLSRSLMVHGRDPEYLNIEDDDGLARDALRKMMQRRYSFKRLGFSCRATEMEAALGNGELDDCALSTRTANRISVARKIGTTLSPFADRIAPQDWPDGSSPLFYPFVCDSEETRDGLSIAFEEAGIETRPIMPLLCQPPILEILERQGRAPDDYPGAMKLMRCGFLISCHPWLTDEHIDGIRNTTEGYFA